jgi:hypothetical protein
MRKRFSQLMTAGMQVPPHGGRRRASGLGDVGDGHFLELEELYHQTPSRRKLVERGTELLHEVRSLGLLVRRAVTARDRRIESDGYSDAPRGLGVQAAVHDDASKPRPEWAIELEIIDVTEGGEERILNDVFSISSILEDTRRHGERPWEMALDQRAERAAIPGAYAPDEPCFGLLVAFAGQLKGTVSGVHQPDILVPAAHAQSGLPALWYG